MTARIHRSATFGTQPGGVRFTDTTPPYRISTEQHRPGRPLGQDVPFAQVPDQFSGRRKLWSWAALCLVGAIMWTAVFAAVLA